MTRSIVLLFSAAVAASGCTVGSDTCVAVPLVRAIGEACAPGECGNGVECIDGVCTSTGRWREPCGEGCEDGLVCTDGVCRGARDTAPGERCDATAPEPCTDGHWCWRAEFGTHGECVRRTARGEPCADYDECESGLLCVDGLCADPPLAGQRCDLVSRCAEGFFCDDGFCFGPPVAEGDPCRPSECPAGLYCSSEGACAPALAEGDPCRGDREDAGCGEGLYCHATRDVCERPLAAGEECAREDRCAGGTVCQLVDAPSGARRCDAPVERGGFCGDGQVCEPGTYCDARMRIEPADCFYPPCP